MRVHLIIFDVIFHTVGNFVLFFCAHNITFSVSFFVVFVKEALLKYVLYFSILQICSDLTDLRKFARQAAARPQLLGHNYLECIS